jgi:signal transduction histidine kinase
LRKRDADIGFDVISALHADDRLAHGFPVNDLIAKFRALRASVLRRYAQRTDRIRDLVAGALAHDLRSPLGAILNSAEVLVADERLSRPSIRAGPTCSAAPFA